MAATLPIHRGRPPARFGGAGAAFTLVEILIVVVLLGILAAIVVPQFRKASNDARESALARDLQTIRSQLQVFKVQHNGPYPTDVTLLTKKTTVGGVESATGAYGPYVEQMPTNPFTETSDVQTATKGAGSQAWYYNSTTGEFAPNDASHTSW